MSAENNGPLPYKYNRCDGSLSDCGDVMRAIKDTQGILYDLATDVKQVINLVNRMDERVKTLTNQVGTLDTIVRGDPTAMDTALSTKVTMLRNDVDELKKKDAEILAHKRYSDVTIKVAVVASGVGLVGVVVQIILHFLGSK